MLSSSNDVEPPSAIAADASPVVEPLSLTRRSLFKAGIAAATSIAACGAGAAELPVPREQGSAHSCPNASIRRRVPVNVTVNGVAYALEPESDVTLLDLLREGLRLTGTKKGCNRGECGACTVMLDHRRVNACLVLAATLDGRQVRTIEGLANGERLHPVQRAFIEHDAFQCGFCTCGQIMSAVGCIEEGHTRSNAEIREWMSGNLCRCSAYPQIAAAVEAAALEMHRGDDGTI